MSTLPRLAWADLAAAGLSAERRPLLVLGPSLGTSVDALWGHAAALLSRQFDIVGFDLPGHGRSPSATGALDMAALAAAVVVAVDEALATRGRPGEAFFYAGVSIAGCIGLQLLRDAPARVARAAIVCSAAKIGQAAGWQDRADLVLREGVAPLREASAQRWFAPGFVARQPEVAGQLLDSLCAAQPGDYAALCGALGGFDLRGALAGIEAPVLVIGGECDVATPPEQQHELAQGLPHGRVEILPAVAHLAPAEAPEAVAGLLRGFFAEHGQARPGH